MNTLKMLALAAVAEGVRMHGGSPDGSDVPTDTMPDLSAGPDGQDALAAAGPLPEERRPHDEYDLQELADEYDLEEPADGSDASGSPVGAAQVTRWIYPGTGKDCHQEPLYCHCSDRANADVMYKTCKASQDWHKWPIWTKKAMIRESGNLKILPHGQIKQKLDGGSKMVTTGPKFEASDYGTLGTLFNAVKAVVGLKTEKQDTYHNYYDPILGMEDYTKRCQGSDNWFCAIGYTDDKCRQGGVALVMRADPDHPHAYKWKQYPAKGRSWYVPLGCVLRIIDRDAHYLRGHMSANTDASQFIEYKDEDEEVAPYCHQLALSGANYLLEC